MNEICYRRKVFARNQKEALPAVCFVLINEQNSILLSQYNQIHKVNKHNKVNKYLITQFNVNQLTVSMLTATNFLSLTVQVTYTPDETGNIGNIIDFLLSGSPQAQLLS
jgi:hypothetical protein